MWISTQVWADGRVPGFNSIIGIGAAVFHNLKEDSFLGMASPISDSFDESLLTKYNITRTQQLQRAAPQRVITAFVDWVNSQKVPNIPTALVSDNSAHDWMFISYYCEMYNLTNPFDTARSINDIFAGLVRNMEMGRRWISLKPKYNLNTPEDIALANVTALKRIADRARMPFPGYVPTEKLVPMLQELGSTSVKDDINPNGFETTRHMMGMSKYELPRAVPGAPPMDIQVEKKEELPIHKKPGRRVRKTKPGPKIPPRPVGRPTKEEQAEERRKERNRQNRRREYMKKKILEQSAKIITQHDNEENIDV